MELDVKFEESNNEFEAGFAAQHTLTSVGIEEIFAYNTSSESGEASHYAIRLTDGREYPFYVTNGEDGEAGKAPRLRINPDTNLWEVDYIGDATWESLGVPATGPKGDKGDKGDRGESAVMVVIIDDYDWTADHSALEILQYMQEAPVIGAFSGAYRLEVMTLCGVLEVDDVDDLESHHYATFKTAADANGVWKEYTIDDNKNVTVKEMSISSASVETLVVTIDESTNKASHTAEQITEHIQNGGNVVLHWNESYYLPAIATNTYVTFAHAVSIMDETTIFGVSVFANGDVVKIDVPLATANQIGSIETALDSIIAIQNQLIGGDA